MERVAQAVESLGTEKVVRKDLKAVAEGMAQARWVPEEVVARPLEMLMGEGQGGKSPVLEKREQELPHSGNHGKSRCGFPRDTGHQRASERDDLGKNPSG